jgi:hypothetical protein
MFKHFQTSHAHFQYVYNNLAVELYSPMVVKIWMDTIGEIF